MRTFLSILAQHQAVFEQLANNNDTIEAAGALLIDTLKQEGKVLLCGNGGSAADCQHIAAEFVVRYEKDRKALPAIALTTDTSILTASANDFDFNSVFSRQVEALGNAHDCLIAISTSGRSGNVIAAVKAAKAKGMNVIALTGHNESELSRLASITVKIPSTVTARIQEAHILIGHWWCAIVEDAFSEEAVNAVDNP
ncbi:phosphoheptose isomerase GmhA [Methyloglobulus morosus KoM1]|uniref:Phosphoheptose isomerase n=1 Tax=Methyloglobulus morosus KoM1 TaxID=1116472 RepID=V5BXC4_9GAMM|nr:SIS domain-containing protein [Methyloglobulus morosus]ESS69188.1 phosphoheptose isomerase GmhA [Methyloglobulus morosus KoM1]